MTRSFASIRHFEPNFSGQHIGHFSRKFRIMIFFKVAKRITPSPSTYPLNAIEETSTLLKKSFNKKLGTRPEPTMIREELTSSDIPPNNLLINAIA